MVKGVLAAVLIVKALQTPKINFLVFSSLISSTKQSWRNRKKVQLLKES